jgi:hypothetical protein
MASDVAWGTQWSIVRRGVGMVHTGMMAVIFTSILLLLLAPFLWLLLMAFDAEQVVLGGVAAGDWFQRFKDLKAGPFSAVLTTGILLGLLALLIAVASLATLAGQFLFCAAPWRAWSRGFALLNLLGLGLVLAVVLVYSLPNLIQIPVENRLWVAVGAGGVVLLAPLFFVLFLWRVGSYFDNRELSRRAGLWLLLHVAIAAVEFALLALIYWRFGVQAKAHHWDFPITLVLFIGMPAVVLANVLLLGKALELLRGTGETLETVLTKGTVWVAR